MISSDVFAASAIERRAVANLVEVLDESQLGTASLCAGWDVRTVTAHLASAVTPSKMTFLVAALRAGGNLHRANEAVARDVARQPVMDVVRALRDNADSRFAPPVVGARGPRTDVLVHAGDIRVPLGLPHAPAGAHVQVALEFVTEGRPVGFVPRGLLRDLRLAPDDMDCRWGEGAVLTGRGIDLLMAACSAWKSCPTGRGAGSPQPFSTDLSRSERPSHQRAVRCRPARCPGAAGPRRRRGCPGLREPAR